MKSARLILFAGLVALTNVAISDMFVDRSIVIFEPGDSPRQDIKVSNNGEDTLYIQVDVLTVNNPGAADEARVQIADPNERKLITTPSKLVIPPNGQKLIRIVNLQSQNDKERVYRINVTPIVPPLEEETSQLRIVVAYQILTIVQPDVPSSEIKVSRTGNQISFVNQGNTNVLLSDGMQCQDEAGNKCSELSSRRLYAGNAWVAELPFDAPVSYSLRSFDGIKKQIFP